MNNAFNGLHETNQTKYGLLDLIKSEHLNGQISICEHLMELNDLDGPIELDGLLNPIDAIEPPRSDGLVKPYGLVG